MVSVRIPPSVINAVTDTGISTSPDQSFVYLLFPRRVVRARNDVLDPTVRVSLSNVVVKRRRTEGNTWHRCALRMRSASEFKELAVIVEKRRMQTRVHRETMIGNERFVNRVFRGIVKIEGILPSWRRRMTSRQPARPLHRR
jgi:hypothetical protein